MNKDDVHRAVFAVAEIVMGQDPTITGESEIHFDVGMDSLDIIEFQQELEDRLDVLLPEEFVQDNDTMNDVVERVWELIQEQDKTVAKALAR